MKIRIFKKIFSVTLIIISIFLSSGTFYASATYSEPNDYVRSEPINDMSMYDGRFKNNNIVMIGDESLNLFKVNVYIGANYLIEDNVTLLQLEDKVKQAKKYNPSAVIFYIGLHDYKEKTPIREFKDAILKFSDIIKKECKCPVAFLSYLDYKEFNDNPHNYSDYDNAIKDCAKENPNIIYLDTKYIANTDMIFDGVNYNKEYLFYTKYVIIEYLYRVLNVDIKNVFVGDSRTVDLSKNNDVKGSEFIGIPAGKYLEFEKTMDNIIKKHFKNCNVIILYGINDIEKTGVTNVEKYINYLNLYHNDFFARNIKLYIATVMEQKDLNNILTFPRNYTLYTRNGALNFLDGHIHTIDLYTYMFIITAKLGKDEVFRDEIHFTDEASKLILEYLYDNIE